MFLFSRRTTEKIKTITDFRNMILSVGDSFFVYKTYKLPINHFEPSVFLYKHGIDLIKNKQVLENKDFIDAGAFIGDSALVLSEYGAKQIYSFEINPENITQMEKTIEMNSLNNVTIVRKALWSSETKLELNLCGSASSFNKLSGIAYGETIKVPTTTLDKFVTENKLNVGLIKVDLEGAEQEFLKGARETIKRQKPILLLSIYHKPTDFFELKPILEAWVPDYEFTIFKPIDESIILETILIAQTK